MLNEGVIVNDTKALVKDALEAAPRASSGALGGFAAGAHNIDEWVRRLGAALRAIRQAQAYISDVEDAVSPMTGFISTRLDGLQALLGAYKLTGWESLLKGGRLSKLLDLNPETVTRAGVALQCFHSIIPTAPPQQREHLQALVDELDSHRRVEEVMIQRDDELQTLYDGAIDAEMGRLTSMQGHITGLTEAMLEESAEDEESPSNVYSASLAQVNADTSLSPEAKAEQRATLAEQFFLDARGAT